MFYLSFVASGERQADAKPGDCNLGVTVVDGDTLEDAIAEATRLGLNPGGEVAGWHIPVWRLEDLPEAGRTFYRRLVPVEEMRSRGERTLGEIEDEDPELGARINANQLTVCACCNGKLHK